MIHLDQMKHTCHNKGCPNSPISTQCSPHWLQRRRVFSSAKDHNGAECYPAIDCPKHRALLSQFGNGCGRLWRKIELQLRHVPYMLNWREIGVIVGQGSCTPRRTPCVAAAVCGRGLSCWKSRSPFCRRNGSSTGLTPCVMTTLPCRNTKCDREL